MRLHRPRWTLFRAGLVLGGAVALLAVTAVAGSIAYGEFGYHPDRNAREWASLEPRYETSESCRACHPAALTTWTAARHASTACTTCHGPTPHTEEAAVTLRATTASGSLCLRCHEAVSGRPASFPQIDTSKHYATGMCQVCHDPHTPAGVPPPVVSHPQANLPECTACHRVGGLKPLPQGHVPASDARCRVCHLPGSQSD